MLQNIKACSYIPIIRKLHDETAPDIFYTEKAGLRYWQLFVKTQLFSFQESAYASENIGLLESFPEHLALPGSLSLVSTAHYSEKGSHHIIKAIVWENSPFSQLPVIADKEIEHRTSGKKSTYYLHKLNHLYLRETDEFIGVVYSRLSAHYANLPGDKIIVDNSNRPIALWEYPVSEE